MSTGRKRTAKLPRVRAKDPETQRMFDALAEIIEVGEGERGDKLDAKVTWRDLVGSGFARPRGSGGGFPAEPRPVEMPSAGPPNMAIPPAPENLEAAGAVQNVILSWDAPYDAYGNHAFTEVWRSTENDLGQAVLVGQSDGSMFTDPVGPGSAFYYWIRFVSTSDVAGPYNAVQGTYVETAIDVEYMLGKLSGQIREDQLYDDLNSRIDLIDGSEFLEGSVANLVGQEAQAREAAITSVEEAISNEESARASAINQVSTQLGGDIAAIETRSSSWDGVAAQWSVKAQVGDLVGGIGLMTSGGRTRVYINADTIAFYNSGSNNGLLPFVIDDDTTYIKSAAILDGTITRAKIGTAAIDDAKIANGAITDAKIENGSITTAKIRDLAVDTLQIRGNAVTVPVVRSLPSTITLNHGGTRTHNQYFNLGSSAGGVLCIVTAEVRGLDRNNGFCIEFLEGSSVVQRYHARQWTEFAMTYCAQHFFETTLGTLSARILNNDFWTDIEASISVRKLDTTFLAAKR